MLYEIFLDLQKAYDALERSKCLYILDGYGVGPRYLHLLHMYWERLQMVEQTGGYYRETFHGERGITQGDTLSPTIFNVVVDAVVCHWDSLVLERAEGNTSYDNGNTAHPMGWTIRKGNTANSGRMRGM